MAYTYTTWTPDLNTGHGLIDEQHKQLIDAVNELFDAQKNGRGPQAVQKTMDFLVNYTIKHFTDEEALQEKHGYPEYPTHKQIHTDFKEVAQELRRELSRRGPTDDFINHVCVTIGRWVINHIKDKDFVMTAHLRSKEQNG